MHLETIFFMELNTQINTLIKHVERRIGRPIKSPVDFDLLSLRISEQISEQISTTTLKRIFGYIYTEHTPRYSTLSILSRFVGYEDWEDFCCSAISKDEDDSGFITNKVVYSEYLSIGDRIELCWRPNRRCVVKFDGDNGYTVVESYGAKIQAGDTFHTQCFMLGHPLVISDLRRSGSSSPRCYIAGNRYGLSSITILK